MNEKSDNEDGNSIEVTIYLKFSGPYNNDFSLLEELMEIDGLNGNKISEVYFPCPQEYFGSGRLVSKISVDDVIKINEFCHKYDIRTNLVLNSTCEGLNEYNPEYINRTIEFVDTLHRTYGLDGIIVANPITIRRIKKTIPTIDVVASAFSNIDSVQRAVFFDQLGADVLTLKGINRARKCETDNGACRRGIETDGQ